MVIGLHVHVFLIFHRLFSIPDACKQSINTYFGVLISNMMLIVILVQLFGRYLQIHVHVRARITVLYSFWTFTITYATKKRKLQFIQKTLGDRMFSWSEMNSAPQNTPEKVIFKNYSSLVKWEAIKYSHTIMPTSSFYPLGKGHFHRGLMDLQQSHV